MIGLDPYSLGILLVALGLFFWLITRFLTRTISSSNRVDYPDLEQFSVPVTAGNSDAVIVVRSGGKLVSLNDNARKIFHVQEKEMPDLERLARWARPSETFLGLCGEAGQESFVLDGRLVEGTSYRLSFSEAELMVIYFRPIALAGNHTEKEIGVTAESLRIFTELTQSMSGSLDLEEILSIVLGNVIKLFPVDYVEISTWDSDGENLIPFSLPGAVETNKTVVRSGSSYRVGERNSGILEQTRKPLLISKVTVQSNIAPIAGATQGKLQSYLGVPLVVGDEFVGTLELASLMPNTFQQKDLELMGLISGQAANSIHNAMIFENEERKAAELSGLADLSNALRSVREPKRVFSRLVDSISPLISVEILGFLIFSENERMLEAQIPFHGLPSQIVDLYHIPVEPKSEAERVFLEQDVIFSENAAEDPYWEDLGLDVIAKAASMQETILIPLTSGGRMLGYLQASNHIERRRSFSKEEMHFLTIVANQAAPIIENATLVKQTRQRAHRAEVLRRIASFAGSDATLEEILNFSTRELSNLLRSDIAAFFLLGRNQDIIQFHRSSFFGKQRTLPDRVGYLSVEDPQFPFTVTGKQHVFRSGNLNEELAVIPFYRDIIEHWQIKSVIAVPLVFRDLGIGELWLGSTGYDFFDQGDLQAVVTAAGQLAGVVEQAYLMAQTDESLRRRIDQLTALTRISREVSASLDLNHLLQLIYKESLRITHADRGTVLLFNVEDIEGEAELRFMVGEDHPENLMEIEQDMIQKGEPVVISSDFEKTGLNVGNDVKSVLFVPFYYQQHPGGLFILHSSLSNEFDEVAIEIAQSLAFHTSVVIASVLQQRERLKREALPARESKTLNYLPALLDQFRKSTSLEQTLESVGHAIQEITDFQMVLFSIYDRESEALRRVAHVGLPEAVWKEMRQNSQPLEAVKALLTPDYQHGLCYYIPVSSESDLPEGLHSIAGLTEINVRELDAWNPDDMLLLPLFDSQQEILGLISLDAPKDGREPDDSIFDILNIFGLQIAQLLESTNQLSLLQSQIHQAEEKESIFNTVQEQLYDLKEKDAEQTIVVQKLSKQRERMQLVQNIIEMANWQPDMISVLRMVAKELLAYLKLQVAIIAESSRENSHLIEIIGELPEGNNPEALYGQRNPLRYILDEGDSLFISDTSADPNWQDNQFLNSLNAKSCIGFPFSITKERIIGILLLGDHTLEEFDRENRIIYTQLARQISVSLENLHLLKETQRNLHDVNTLLEFTQKLGSLDPSNILKVLLESVKEIVPTAEAGWVGLWNQEKGRIEPCAARGYKSDESILQISHVLSGTGSEDDPLPLRSLQTGKISIIDEDVFIRENHLSEQDLLRYRSATGGLFPLSSLIVPIQSSEDSLGILVAESFDEEKKFDKGDKALILSLVQQAGLALENARLFVSSEQRAAQLEALTNVAETITSSLKSNELIQILLDQLTSVVPYETATLWLRDKNQLKVAAAAGFKDSESREDLLVEVEDSALFQEMVKTGEAIAVDDIRKDARFPSLVEPENFSWLGIPLIAKSELTGIIALEKQEAGFYKPDFVRAATTFASQAAISLENARLFEERVRRAAELDSRSQRLALLNRFSSELGASLSVDHILEQTAKYSRNALNTDIVAVAMIGADGKLAIQHRLPELESDIAIDLNKVPIFDRLRDSLSIFSSNTLMNEKELGEVWTCCLEPHQIQSLLIVPFVTGSKLYGWLLLMKKESYRFSSSEIELARTISNQAAISLQNASLYAETRNLSQNLEIRVKERSAQLYKEHKNTETLLKISDELSGSLDIREVLNRVLGVLNESLQAEQSLVYLPDESNRDYRVGTSLAASLDHVKLTGVNLERQIAERIMKDRASRIIEDVTTDSDFEFPGDLHPGYKCVLATPLIFGEEVLGGLLMLHRQVAFFEPDQLKLVEASARQIGIALNKAELFSLIRDQAENLGGMLREQQIEANRSRAILEAVADGVVVTDNENRITLFNSSAERILGVESDDFLNQSVKLLMGVLGEEEAERSWLDLIIGWADGSQKIEQEENYSDQFDLENGRFVAVSLAPVFWNSNFMGTVSIFRDITHEVQVDRLKSEFVANVSHELRTPMTSIKGYAQVLLMGAAGELTEQQRHFTEIIANNTNRLGVLVNDLLDISRIEASRLSLMLQSLALDNLAEDVIADIYSRSEEDQKPMSIALRVPENLPEVNGDPGRVRQILNSLILNAYNYTPPNGQIQVEIHREENEVQVDVQDNGVGIKVEEQGRIFERFYRGENALVMGAAGTGLGLSISKTLVEMHLGRIWFHSSGVPGEGSTFSFTLPIYKPKE